MGTFSGQLNSNEIFSALYNMIISQQVFADNIKGTNSALVDSARVDGSLNGDTKLFYSTDVLRSHAWGNDNEATNLLALDRPNAPQVQSITLNVFRQIRLTTDQYLSKRAWADEGTFQNFTSVMMGWIKETKRVYDSTLYNSYIGTAKGSSNTATYNIPVGDITETGEDKRRLEAQMIAQYLADLMVNMTDISRDFNDYKQLRSYDKSEIRIVWNSKWLNKITKLDLPTIFHKDGLLEGLNKDVLPSRYFGNINTSAGSVTTNTNVRSLYEADYTDSSSVKHHIFAGDLLPNNVSYLANTTYTEDDTIICKVMTKLPPYMSAFEVATSFFNPRSLTENNYLTFGHNTLEYLKAFPLVEVKAYTTPAQEEQQGAQPQ